MLDLAGGTARLPLEPAGDAARAEIAGLLEVVRTVMSVSR
jgi:hypothetical protein